MEGCVRSGKIAATPINAELVTTDRMFEVIYYSASPGLRGL